MAYRLATMEAKAEALSDALLLQQELFQEEQDSEVEETTSTTPECDYTQEKTAPTQSSPSKQIVDKSQQASTRKNTASKVQDRVIVVAASA
jgi:hypothetical protein